MAHDGIVHGDAMFSYVILGDSVLAKLHRRLRFGGSLHGLDVGKTEKAKEIARVQLW